MKHQLFSFLATGLALGLGACTGGDPGTTEECGGNGHLHDGHCHCEEGFEVDPDDDQMCIAEGDTDGAEECGGHGTMHGDHCDCDEGYEHPPNNDRTCVAEPMATGERLVVADPAASRMYVFELGTWELLAEFEDLQMNDHAGFLPLSDGRLVFHDASSNSLGIASIGGDETPALAASMPVAGQVAHIAVSPGEDYLVASASLETEGEGAFTLIELDGLAATEVLLPTGEPGVALGGDPLMLFHRNNAPAQFEMYPVAELADGTATPADTVTIGEGPHGEVIAHGHGKIVSAADDGINVVPFDESGFGSVVKVPYDVDGMSGGRAFYARLSGDGRYLYSYLRDSGPEGTTWGGWRSDAYILDLETDTARRMEIGNGLVYRLGACPTMAAFTQYHPDGDFVHLMDADPSSEDFQEFVASVPLEAMSQAPGPDGDIWSSVAFRITAMSTDCRYAFVTHGGDGKISVIDTEAAVVVHTLEVPTALDYGGYLVSVKAGTETVDTIGR